MNVISIMPWDGGTHVSKDSTQLGDTVYRWRSIVKLHTKSKQCTQANDHAIADALIQCCFHHTVVVTVVVKLMLGVI